MKDRSNDPSHHEQTLLTQSYISLPRRKRKFLILLTFVLYLTADVFVYLCSDITNIHSSVFSLQPPRTAHPIVWFSCSPCDPIVIENLPFDKYELEPSPLTQYILERRQPNSCWQVTRYSHRRSVRSFLASLRVLCLKIDSTRLR